MTVGTNTYGSVAEIQKLIGDLVDNRTFTVTTIPTLSQVETTLDGIAAEINNSLDIAGYAVPVVSADYPVAFAYLKAANEYGAASLLLGTIPGLAQIPDDQVDPNSEDRGKGFYYRFKACLTAIQKHQLRAGMRSGRMALLYTGAQKDSEGNEKDPLFTRNMDDYPGVILNGSSDTES